MSFEDNTFKSIELVRAPQAGAMAFGALSGGTREQVAAAVRLAIAELLAAEHEGTLPVVFDDAFAYSDPERVHVLQRMLDLGATRGLQIIVLTCNPSDYAALGARQVILSPKSIQGPVSPGMPATQDPESSLPSSTAEVNASPEYGEQFLAALTALGGKSGNHSLRDQLGWEDAKYIAVKDQLLAQNRIIPGKGRGGSVAIRD